MCLRYPHVVYSDSDLKQEAHKIALFYLGSIFGGDDTARLYAKFLPTEIVSDYPDNRKYLEAWASLTDRDERIRWKTRRWTTFDLRGFNR